MMLTDPPWTFPPDELMLNTSSVHVWFAPLDVEDTRLQFYWATLSQDERRRAEKFSFDLHRTHFIVGRGILRHILGRYLFVAPDSIRFEYNAFGKPSLELSPGRAPLYFNMAHSNDCALFAFTLDGAVGVDIEYIRDDIQIEQTGALVFSTGELAALGSIPPERQHHTFFKFWTRKEAYIKGVGQGLTMPLRQFDVRHTPEQPVRYEGEAMRSFQPNDWFVRDIDLTEAYCAAVAMQGRAWEVSFFRLPDVYPF